MRLQALSTGAGFPSGRFTGVVHSVFRQACNIRTATAHCSRCSLRSWAMRPASVELPSGLAFSDHLRAGQRVGCRGAVLRVGGADFAVDLVGAERWRGEPDASTRSEPARGVAWPGKRRGKALTAAGSSAGGR